MLHAMTYEPPGRAYTLYPIPGALSPCRQHIAWHAPIPVNDTLRVEKMQAACHAQSHIPASSAPVELVSPHFPLLMQCALQVSLKRIRAQCFRVLGVSGFRALEDPCIGASDMLDTHFSILRIIHAQIHQGRTASRAHIKNQREGLDV